MKILDRFKAAFSGEVVAATDLSQWKERCQSLEAELSEIEKLVVAREDHIKTMAEAAKAAEDAAKAAEDAAKAQAAEAEAKAAELNKSIEDAGLPKTDKTNIETQPKPDAAQAFAHAATLATAEERKSYLKAQGLL